MPSQNTSVDLSTRNTLSEQLDNINLNQKNALAILTAMHESFGGKETVTIPITSQDGSITNIEIKSTSFLFSEIEKIKQSIKSLSGLQEGSATYISAGNSYRKIIVEDSIKTFSNIKNFITRNDSVGIDKESALWNLMFPLTRISFTLSGVLAKSDYVNAITFRVTNDDRFAQVIKDGMSYAEVLHLHKSGKISGEWYNDSYKTESINKRYYGEFDVVKYETRTDGLVNVTVSTTNYSDNKSIENTIELVTGDILASSSGKSSFKIKTVDHNTKTLVLEQIRGVEGLNEIEKFCFVDSTPDTRELRIPIKGKERSIVFLSPVNSTTSHSSEFTTGYVVNTSEMTILQDGITQSFDSYFETKVADIGYLIEQMMSDVSIPISKGVKPEKPFIDPKSLQVIQINKHLSNTNTTRQIEELAVSKEKTANDISVVNNQIYDISERINENKYKTNQDRQKDQKQLNVLTDEKRRLTAYYSSLVNDISTKSRKDDLSTLSPKFRIRGFFPVQDLIKSIDTRNQIIIGYHIEYRYTSPNLNNSESILLTYKDETGKSYHGTFSSWIRQSSPTLKKVKNEDGSLTWNLTSTSDGNEININQIDIPIRPNESVEIRVRSISEAGYPFSELTSEWSDVVKIEFPDELKDSLSIAGNLDKNDEDKKIVDIQNVINSYGIEEHLITSYKEQDKYFAHNAHTIASGFRTPEQVSISLYDHLLAMQLEIKQLKDKLNRSNKNVTIDIVDEFGNTYDVINYHTITINGGTYNRSDAGKIITKKYFIRLRNLNIDPIHIGTLDHGDPTTQSSEEYQNVALRLLNQSEDNNQQRKGQIIYFRNTDLTGYKKLYKSSSSVDGSVTIAGDEDKKTGVPKNAYDSNKNMFGITEPRTPNLVVFHKSHPGYDMSTDRWNETIARVQKMTSAASENDVQVNDGVISYNKEDRYLIGANSCGAYLYPIISDIKSIQVRGIGRNATLQMDPSTNSTILIPIIFEYRLIDAIGRYLGQYSMDDAAVRERQALSKTLGVSLMIDEAPFMFDIQITCTYESNDRAVGDIDQLNKLAGKIKSVGSTTPEIK